MKSFPFFRMRFRFLLWLVLLIILVVLSLGFPVLYFSVTDEKDFSALEVQDTGLNEKMYVDANNEQVVSMLLEGKFMPIYEDSSGEYMDVQEEVTPRFSQEYAAQQVKLCLESFSKSSAQILGKMFQTLFLDEWEHVDLLDFQELVGVGVYEDTVVTSNLYLAFLSKAETDDLPAATLTVTFNPIDLTIYSFGLGNIKWKSSDHLILEEGLREYELIYLGLNPLKLEMESEQEKMSAYSSKEGSFLPSVKSNYRFLLYPVSVYFDGYFLSVNETM